MFQPFKSATKEPRTQMATAQALQNRSEIDKAKMENAQRAENMSTFVNVMKVYNEAMDRQGRTPIEDKMRGTKLGDMMGIDPAKAAQQKSAQDMGADILRDSAGTTGTDPWADLFKGLKLDL
jgi:hypothetical protein